MRSVDTTSPWRRPAGALARVIAHRGASAVAPENTLAAFEAARAAGADGVELDVWRCASGELVVFHDADLMRLTGTRGHVATLPLSALRGLRVAGEHVIPTLDEALEAIGPTLLVNIEVKALELQVAPGLAAAVAQRCAPEGTRVLVSSFHPGVLLSVRRMEPTVPVALLCHGKQRRPLREGWLAPIIRPEAIHPEYNMLTPRRMRRWRSCGYVINAWTVDSVRHIERAVHWGVDGIITDDPAASRVAMTVTAGQTQRSS